MDSSIMPLGVCILFLTLGLTSVRTTLHPAGPGTEDPDWEDTSPEEGPFIEGDIVTGSETIPVAEFKPSHRNLVANPRLLWPQKTLYYEFSTGQFHGELRTLVEEALSDIMEHSCVRFSPRGHQTTYLKLKGTGKGCNSKVGYPEEEGPLTLQVAGRKCHTLGTVQHEFLHALGLWHEHTRADRDNYVTVVWENVRPDRKSNFVKRSDDESIELLNLPYDYGSIMHYKTSSFTKHRGSSTLLPRHKEAVKVMGQRVGITKGDIAKLNRLYNCTGKYYTGEDLEGKKFLLGQYYKSGVNVTPRDFEEELEFGEDIRSNQHANDATSDTSIREKTAIEDMQLRTGNTNQSYQSNGNYVTNDERRKLKEIEKYKAHKIKEGTDKVMSAAFEYIERYGMENATGLYMFQKKLHDNQSKTTIDKLDTYLNVNHSDESSRKTTSIIDLLSTKKELNENDMRRKRETAGAKVQRDGNPETAKQQTNENHESFAPQKILPELLKGVLSTDNDRPIVIQFAIYQPIVYKHSNQSESSNEDSKGEDKSDEERRKYDSGERRGNEARNSDSKDYDTEQRSETNPIKSFQKAQDFDRKHDDNSRLSNKNQFSEHDVKRQEDDDRIDVRSFDDRRTDTRRQHVEYNTKLDYNYERSTKPTNVREENYPEHQTEYVPVSVDHDITVSKKEYTVSSHDSHVNGQELRVSQTDYKIEPKVSRNHNDDFPIHSSPLSEGDVLGKTPESDDITSDDVENPETSYPHEEREYTNHSPEKGNIQPLKASHRESGYEASSLINFSRGKGTKTSYERENNNNFRDQVKYESLPHNYREEETMSQQTPLELKKGHQEYRVPSQGSHEISYMVHSTKDDDIAPNFSESSSDDHVFQPTSENPFNDDADSSDDNVHDLTDHHFYPGGEIKESHNKVKNVESRSSDVASGTYSSSNGNAGDEILDQRTIKNTKEDNIPYENRSFERSRVTNGKENKPNTIPKSSIIRNEEVLSSNKRSHETFIGVIEKTSNSGKKITRPDIVTDEDFSSELDIGERGRKTKTDPKNDDTLEAGHTKTQDSALPNNRGNIRNKNRIQSNVKSTVVRKKVQNTRIEPEEQQEFVDEEDLISKPQTSKLNLNPRQALPLKTSVNMGRKTF